MGDVGSGKLEVFHPKTKEWRPACAEADWNKRESPRYICRNMGYRNGSSKLNRADSDLAVMAPKAKAGTVPLDGNVNASYMYQRLRSCAPTDLSVRLTCTDFRKAELYATALLLAEGQLFER